MYAPAQTEGKSRNFVHLGLDLPRDQITRPLTLHIKSNLLRMSW